jgi:hypothetical protein
MLVKIVWPVLLGVSVEGGHLKVHASVGVSANGRVRRSALGHDCVNDHYRRENILSGSDGESVDTRDLVLSVHFGEQAEALSPRLPAIHRSWDSMAHRVLEDVQPVHQIQRFQGPRV